MVRSISRAFFRVLGLIVVISALLFTGCDLFTSPNEPTGDAAATPTTGVGKPVEVAQAKRSVLSNELSYSGNVLAKKQVAIVPKLGGRVVKLHVDVGSAVKAGDVLVELDKDALAAQVAQAEAGLAAAQAQLARAEAGPRGEQVGQAEANLKAAQAQLDQLKAGATPEQIAQAEAQVRLAHNQLFSVQTQADAYLGSAAVAMGGMVFTPDMKEAQSGVAWEQVQVAEAALAQLKAGATPQQIAQAEAAVEVAQHQLALARNPVTEQDLLAARAAVAQAQAAVDLARSQLTEATISAPFDGVVAKRIVAEGAMAGPTSPMLTLISSEAEVIINVDESSLSALEVGQTAFVTTNAYPLDVFEATVTSIAPAVDPQSRSVQVRLTPVDSEQKLRDGMFAQVTLQAEIGKEDALLVPAKAVVREDRDTVVYAVRDGKAQRRVVTTGVTDGERIEITAGLAEDEMVVISGQNELKDGQEVIIR